MQETDVQSHAVQTEKEPKLMLSETDNSDAWIQISAQSAIDIKHMQ
jgi:hypothetical protein